MPSEAGARLLLWGINPVFGSTDVKKIQGFPNDAKFRLWDFENFDIIQLKAFLQIILINRRIYYEKDYQWKSP